MKMKCPLTEQLAGCLLLNNAVDCVLVTVILLKKILGGRAGKEAKHIRPATPFAFRYEASHLATHQSVLPTTNICTDSAVIHANACLKPIHVGLQEVFDHGLSGILVTALAGRPGH